MKAQWLIKSVVSLSSRAATSARNAPARATVASEEMAEVVMRESRSQPIRCAAHVADEGGPLADLVHNIDR
jgi:hypothetical protein